MAAGGPLGGPCERPGGRTGPGGVLRALRGRRPAQVAVRAGDDAEGSDLRLRDGGVFVAGDRAAAGGGRGVPGSWGGELPEPPDDLRVSPPAPGGLQAAVRGGGLGGARDGRGELRQAVDRRHEGSGEREQAQGDEPRTDAGGGAASQGRDRGAGGAGAGGGRGGGRALRGVASGRRAARGAAPPGGSAGGDPGGEGAPGGAAAGGGRRARPPAGDEAQPEGRAAVQARPPRAGS